MATLDVASSAPLFTWVSIFLLSFSTQKLISASRDRLLPGESISVDQTLVSPDGAFALGFFTPGGNSTTTNRYVGIWFHNIPGKTVVWVANRENPLRDSAGSLTVTVDGNLALLDAQGSALWSTNVTSSPTTTATDAAVLLDSGNLVLRDGQGKNLWQSFDHPGDTFIPGMRLRTNFKGHGAITGMRSWRSPDDPSPGNFTMVIDPKAPLQLLYKEGASIRCRSAVWNGKSLTSVRKTNTTTLFVLTVENTGEEITMSFRATGISGSARYVLEPTGVLKLLFLPEGSRSDWVTIQATPSKPCDPYNRCGPSGVCEEQGSAATCSCLPGFVPRNPKEWDAGEHYSGCVRRRTVSGDGSDGFLVMGTMKLPDRWRLITDANATRCRELCLTSSICTAYAHANVDIGWIRSRCLVWDGELLDLQHVSGLAYGEDLNLRLAASELEEISGVRDSANKKKHLVILIAPSISVAVLLAGLCGFIMTIRHKKRGKQAVFKAVVLDTLKANSQSFSNEQDSEQPPLLDFNTVLAVTNNFSNGNKLGEGGFGPVYKGELYQGQEVAIKRLAKGSGQGLEEFKNEVQLFARIQHMNVVRLMGWCVHEDEKILIYEYLQNNSLDKFIFDPIRAAELDWEKRFRIIEGIAHGLSYLHRYSRLRVIHRDLKTSNILLDGDMIPKISDFGLARIFGGDQTEANTTRVVGTYGYMSPEYALDGLFSEKSDVFSFGVIIFEIISGKRSTGFYPYKQSSNLLGYVWQFWREGRALELPDLSIGSTVSPLEVMKCIQIGLLCVQENASDRPTISSIVFMLSETSPTLPSPKQPAFSIG